MKNIFLIIITILFFSCTSSRITKHTAQLDDLKTRSGELITKVDLLDKLRQDKISAGEMDDISGIAIEDALKKMKDSISAEIAQIEKLKLSRPKGKNFVALAEARYNSLLNDVLFMDDMFTYNKLTRLSSAAFFDAGSYNVSEEGKTKANEIFKTVSQNLLAFAAKYPGKKLQGMFMVMGYSDEQPVKVNSDLYNDLIKNITDTAAVTDAMLNKELSLRRAKSLSQMLSREFEETENIYDTKNLKVNIFSHGAGEQLPSATIKDYTKDDERRRIVLIFWNIIPA